MFLARFMAGVLAGVVSHQTDHIITALEAQNENGATWYRLSRYGIGYTVAMLVLWIMVGAERKLGRDDVVATGFLAGVSTGIGVIIGYVLDAMLKGKE